MGARGADDRRRNNNGREKKQNKMHCWSSFLMGKRQNFKCCHPLRPFRKSISAELSKGGIGAWAVPAVEIPVRGAFPVFNVQINETTSN